ncbi:unnamed protein product [Linum trigynum]|uniref:UspA domain-containing protein n=1 Tax=Linum trigynum TaxID=586398 RepID=A0AAV2DBH3_9ROSI
MEEAATVAGGGRGEQTWRRPPPMKVMVAIDESDGSFYALQWVLDHLLGVGGIVPSNEPSVEATGMITLLHVQQPFHHHVYPVGPGGGGAAAAFYGTSSSFQEGVRLAQAEASAALLARAMRMCSDKMVKAETLIMEGESKDTICQATEQTHVDLLVVGSRGLGKIKRAFLGSVSDYCAHHAKCAVLIVKPSGDSSQPQSGAAKP